MFQVMKRGCRSSSSCLGGRAAGEDCLERVKEKKDELEEDFEFSPSAAWEEVVEREEGVDKDEEGVEGEGACSREMLGNCKVDGVGFCSGTPLCSSSSSSSSSPESSMTPSSSPDSSVS